MFYTRICKLALISSASTPSAGHRQNGMLSSINLYFKGMPAVQIKFSW